MDTKVVTNCTGMYKFVNRKRYRKFELYSKPNEIRISWFPRQKVNSPNNIIRWIEVAITYFIVLQFFTNPIS